MAVREYRARFDKRAASENATVMRKICDEYITSNSVLEINIQHTQRQAILDSVTSGAVSKEMFDGAEQEVGGAPHEACAALG